MHHVVITLAAPLASAAIAAVCLCRLRGSVRETTLHAAWCWCWFPLFTLLGAAFSARGNFSPETLVLLRFLAATSVFCPFISVLGSKRPHLGAWQFIVMSLWCILNLPVLEVLAYQPAGGLVVSGAQSLFLAGLVALLAVMTLPTRHWLAAVLMVAAQTVWLASHLPWLHTTDLAGSSMYAFGFPLAATAMVIFTSGMKTASQAELSYDRLWLDFRDTFGALWALRVAERINQEARQREWGVLLTWAGFRRADGSPLENEDLLSEHSDLLQTMKNLLRRFVSSRWMDQRLRSASDKG